MQAPNELRSIKLTAFRKAVVSRYVKIKTSISNVKNITAFIVAA